MDIKENMDHGIKKTGSVPVIGFLGVGKMATAMIKGLTEHHIADKDSICGYDVSSEALDRMSGVIRTVPSAEEVVRLSDVLVIAVKPQNITSIIDTVKDVLREDVPVISIAAGVSIGRIKQLAGKDLPVIRVIPNNPMLVGCGMSVMAYEPPVTEEQAAFAEKLFSACGKTVTMAEELINPSIAIHSSSPAYFYLFAKAVADYAESVGIDRKEALLMFSETLKGSGQMIERTLTSSGEDMDDLIAAVKSPGGTTAQALRVFEEGGFCQLIIRAMNACTKRAEELGRPQSD